MQQTLYIARMKKPLGIVYYSLNKTIDKQKKQRLHIITFSGARKSDFVFANYSYELIKSFNDQTSQAYMSAEGK